MRVKDIFHHLFPDKSDYSKRIPPGIVVGRGTLLARGFHLEIRGNAQENRVVVGDNSVLQCHLTLERSVGTIKIGDSTFIGASHLICAHYIEIGSDVLIAWGGMITDHNSHSLRWSQRTEDVHRWREGLQNGNETTGAALKNWDVVPMAPVRIMDKAWIGFGVLVLKGVTIGEGAIVGAGSVVTKDIPPWTIAAGNPARVIREINEDER